MFLGDVNKAIKYYRAAVEIDPKNTQNRNLLGMVLQESGNLADALDQFLVRFLTNCKIFVLLYRQQSKKTEKTGLFI